MALDDASICHERKDPQSCRARTVLYTDEWLVESTKHLSQKAVGEFGPEELSGFKSAVADSEKSHMEHRLREENMQLRQEILKLKRALYMSNDTVQNQTSTIEYSPAYNYHCI